jgi:hypothetical protein
MYIEITPTDEYTELPATLIDGNSTMADNLQLRYLDGNTTNNPLEYSRPLIRELIAEFNTEDTRFCRPHVTVPPSNKLVSVFAASEVEKLRGLLETWEELDCNYYLTDEQKAIEMHTTVADGNTAFHDAAQPSVTINPIIEIPSRSLTVNLAQENPEFNHGKINNVFRFEGFTQVFQALVDGTVELLVIVHGSVAKHPRINTMLANAKFAPKPLNHNLHCMPAGLVSSENKRFSTTYYFPWEKKLEPMNLVRVEATKVQYKVYKYANHIEQKNYYYFEDHSIWRSDVIVVDNLIGDTITGPRYAGLISECPWTIVVDPGEQFEPYAHYTYFKAYYGIPTVEQGATTIALDETARRLKGVIIIGSTPTWCKLEYINFAEVLSRGLYSIEFLGVLTDEELEDLKNPKLTAIRQFNKLLAEGSL